MRPIYLLWIFIPALLMSSIRFLVRLASWGSFQRMLTFVVAALSIMVLYYVES